jgi:hypothetical protein
VRATIFLLNAEGTHDRRDFDTTADDEGRYRLTLPIGRNRLTASADGYSPTSLAVYMAVDQAKDLILEPSAHITGRVVLSGAERVPVAGAEVRLRRENGYDSPGLFLTDERGVFTANALQPGSYRLEARKDALLGRFAEAIVVGATDAIDDVEIVVNATHAVRGRVTAADGTPIAVAAVNLTTDQTIFSVGRPARALTDDEGRYVAGGFLPREYHLAISAEGYATHVEAITLAGDLTRNVVLSAPAVVKGVVLTSGGQPAANAEVTGALVGSSGAKALTSRAATDRRGLFTLNGLGPGSLVVSARKNDDVAVLAPIALGSAGADHVTLTLARGGRISGVVTRADGSLSPLVYLRLTARLLNGAVFTLETAASSRKGSFDFSGVPLGLVRLRAVPLGRPFEESTTEATFTLTADKPETGVQLILP